MKHKWINRRQSTKTPDGKKSAEWIECEKCGVIRTFAGQQGDCMGAKARTVPESIHAGFPGKAKKHRGAE